MKTTQKKYTITDYIFLFFKKLFKVSNKKIKKGLNNNNFLNLLLVFSILLVVSITTIIFVFLRLLVMFS